MLTERRNFGHAENSISPKTLFCEGYNDPTFLDRQVWVNSIDPDQTTSEEAVWSYTYWLPFHLHFLDT